DDTSPVPSTPLSEATVEEVMAVLEAIVADRTLLLDLPDAMRIRLTDLAGKVYSPDAYARRQLVKATERRRKATKIEKEEQVLQNTGIRKLRVRPGVGTPNYFPPVGVEPDEVEDPDCREMREPLICHVCEQDYTEVHHFYDQLCPSCAEFNYAKRSELADLSGRVALLTGGRVKIGYQAGLKMLRAG